MIKNRNLQLLFQTAYCTLGLVAVAASLGLFEMKFEWDFYIFFTNLSNYFCIGVMFAELRQTLRKTEDSYVTASPLLKFVGMLGILLTFLVFNLLLANAADRDPRDNFKVSSILLHIVLPLMYTADWILFYRKGKVKASYPFLSLIFPLTYLAYIYAHEHERSHASHLSVLLPESGEVGRFRSREVVFGARRAFRDRRIYIHGCRQTDPEDQGQSKKRVNTSSGCDII